MCFADATAQLNNNMNSNDVNNKRRGVIIGSSLFISYSYPMQEPKAHH